MLWDILGIIGLVLFVVAVIGGAIKLYGWDAKAGPFDGFGSGSI